MLNKVLSFIKGKLSNEVSTKELLNRGLIVGRNFNRQGECIIDPSHCWLITIGDNVTLAPRVHILAHDASTKTHLDYTKIGNVEIGDNVFVGTGSIILPNVRIGNGSIIGAGSVVNKDIPANALAVGNPARVIMNADDYLERQNKLLTSSPVYDESYTLSGGVSGTKKNQQKAELKGKLGFVK